MSGSFSRPYELRFRSKSTRTNFRAFLRDLCIKFWKLGFFIEKKLTFRFFRFLGKTFTFLIWFKQGRKNLQVKKMSRKKKCFKKDFFWQTDRIMYFSTHPGTLKTVHGNPLNFPSKTTCFQGGPPKFHQKRYPPSNHDSCIVSGKKSGRLSDLSTSSTCLR